MSGLTLEHLDEWYSECTIERCSERTAVALAEQAGIYFSVCLKQVGEPVENPDHRYDGAVGRSKQSICWHLLELRMNTGVHRSGKHYKDWLFEYSCGIETAGARLNSLKSGLKRLMQATVRDYCAGLLSQRSKDQRYGVCSLDEVLAAGDGAANTFMPMARSLLQMSEEPDVRVLCDQEVAAMADSIAEDMSDRQWVILLVKWSELSRADGGKVSLDHKAVLQAAGCGKSQLYAARNGLDTYLRHQINLALSNAAPGEADALLVPVVSELVERIFIKMKSEKRFEPFLTFMEEHQ